MERFGILIITHGSSELAADRGFSDLLYAELKERFPEALVCQAYSAPKTLQRIDRERAQTPVNTVPEMLEYMRAEGVEDLYVLAANLNPCKKYSRVLGMIEPCRDAFSSVRVSPPLLSREADPAKVAGVLGGILKDGGGLAQARLVALQMRRSSSCGGRLWSCCRRSRRFRSGSFFTMGNRDFRIWCPISPQGCPQG